MTFHWKLLEARTYIEGFLGYTFTNVDLLEEALWAMPVTMASGKKLVDGNLGLAMVGDAVLDFVLIEHCYNRGLACGASCVPNLCYRVIVTDYHRRSYR